jgi:hypothetical protein
LSSPDRDAFYVGYLPHAPAALARWLKPRLVLLLVAVFLIAVVLAGVQGRLGPATFEFGEYRHFEGTLVLDPYPMLRLDRPGVIEDLPGNSLYYLVRFGKFGARDAVAEFAGKRVALEGALVYRDEQTMIELKPGSIRELGVNGQQPRIQDLGQQTLTGEIVDSKCFLGVMNPGNLKPHKACATLCIQGGIPPLLLVRSPEGMAHYFLLVGADGRAINDQVLDLVAEPVRVTGRVTRQDNIMLIAADPSAIERID